MTRVYTCEENARNWAAHHGFAISSPLRAEPDRCFYARNAEIDGFILRLIAHGVLSPGNYRNHGPGATSGWRESVSRGAAQVVLYPTEVEIDFDLWNPWDLRGLFGHLWELTTNLFGRKKTDQEKVAELLKKRGIPPIWVAAIQ